MAESRQNGMSAQSGVAIVPELARETLQHDASEEVELSELQQVRRDKVERLREAGVEAYPARAKRTTTAASAKARYVEIEPTLGEHAEDEVEQTLSGRLISRRHQGKTVFGHLRDGSGEIQLYIRRDD